VQGGWRVANEKQKGRGWKAARNNERGKPRIQGKIRGGLGSKRKQQEKVRARDRLGKTNKKRSFCSFQSYAYSYRC